ncbi:MAG TPA: ferrochelatase [Vicinamibacterales bacterium]|nr:ferrochelatase [Vicinamibacterales bacterium]
MNPFDAVLLVAFGGPQGMADIRPFLANVLRGRRVSPARVEEVAHHYERFGGVSPLTELTVAQARAIEASLAGRGVPLPVHVGMRNWHPYLTDTLAAMSRGGIRRAIGILAAAHRSYSGCLQYRENVAQAQAALRAAGMPNVEITWVADWHEHAGFVDAVADQIRQALTTLPDPDAARLVFTAHSIPVSMAERYPYRGQLEASARLVAHALGRQDWALVYQSRSGRPEDPWLGPDVSDYLREARPRGLRAAVLSPVGFVCDHIEVLYDLDVEAAETAREIGLPLARAAAVNAHPRFIDALTDAVLDVYARYRGGRPLALAHGRHPRPSV